MKFSEFVYERPAFEEVAKQLDGLLESLAEQSDAESFYEIFKQCGKVQTHVETMASLASVRHTINTADEFYDKENECWDEYGPMYEVYNNRLAEICLKFPDRESLYKYIPETYFMIAECAVKTFDEKIVPLLQKENKLASEYGKLKASAKIEYNGNTYNLASIGKFVDDPDRNVRREASKARMKFYSDNEEQFDRIYDDLVKVRTEIANQLGYKTFTELGYYRMTRLDYNQQMVANYRKQIIEDIVPLANKLYARQQKRLKLDSLAYYDEKFDFLSGNPTPVGTPDDLVNAAVKMYHELSKETGEFIDLMYENELWDLLSKDNKEMGGYCTSFEEYKVPFIFSNFNGTSGDVDVLTHEAGHAFQYYMSKDIEVSACKWPTMESCEIHSMSMEFFAHPWMESFFKADKDKYYYSHVSDAVKFLPYGALVDHFQHEVYNNPELTPQERKNTWRRLEKEYLPHKNYSECDLLERGGWWYQQGHIFESPFYYIDYTLAQVCAFQFFVRTLKNDENAWSDYITLCKLGGTKPFIELVKASNLKVPFEDGCLKEVSETLDEFLSSLNDENM